jgi:hypothetical protein
VGRDATTGAYSNTLAPGDDAIYALSDSSTKSLKISQQDFLSIPKEYGGSLQSVVKPVVGSSLASHPSNQLIEHLFSARVRGVDVRVVLSDDPAGADGYRNAPIETTVRTFEERFKELEKTTGKKMTGRFDVRGLADAKGKGARNHAKVVCADDAICYIGSQNLYPGGLAPGKGDPAFLALAEWGNIVDDEAKAKEVTSQYFDPLFARKTTRPKMRR